MKPPQPGNLGETDWPVQPLGPFLNVEVTVPLRYISYLWRSLEFPLINCEIELDLLWTKGCILTEHHKIIEGVNFMITPITLYGQVVTLSITTTLRF